MWLLRAIVIGFALLAAGTASADRVFDLVIEIRFSSSGVRGTDNTTGVLTLFDDRTYILQQDGEEASGVWLQEKNTLQLFDEGDVTASENIAWLEEDASDFAGFPVMLTSLKFKEVAKFGRNGNLKVISKQTNTFRPGLRGTSPLKMNWMFKVDGTLR